jgi:hypothetical protein
MAGCSSQLGHSTSAEIANSATFGLLTLGAVAGPAMLPRGLGVMVVCICTLSDLLRSQAGAGIEAAISPRRFVDLARNSFFFHPLDRQSGQSLAQNGP